MKGEKEVVMKRGIRKRWIVSVCIAAGIAVAGYNGVGVLAASVAETEKQEVSEGTDEQTLQNEMKKFVETLGWCDHTANWMADGKSFKEFSSADLSKSFLRMVTNFNLENKRDEIAAKYGSAELLEGAYYIPEETAKQLLIDSIGQYDNSTMDYEGDKIVSPVGDLGTTGVELTDIMGITNISDTDIKVEGSMTFHSEGVITRNVYFSITMTANPESVWGGYTLKSIDKWEDSSDIYILPNSASKTYTAEEIRGLNLYLARNEIYARHGYIFNNADLQEYFGGMSWYSPTTKDVPDSALNEYEKANIELILSLENQ